jgi:nucleoside-diphosphate-sugar epimerase
MKLHKIAVIGGTGKAGSFLVRKLLEKGFQIKLLLRNLETFSNQII